MKERIKKSSKFVFDHVFSKNFLKYLAAGLIAFAVDSIVLYILKIYVFDGTGEKLFGLIYTSKILSSLAGITVSFYLNRLWTFEALEGKVRHQASKMAVVFAFGIIVGSILYSIYYDILDHQTIVNFGNFAITLANAMTVGTMMFANFFLYKFVVFKK